LEFFFQSIFLKIMLNNNFCVNLIAYVSRSVCIQKGLAHFLRKLMASFTNWLI
jgi:hypothetical protein